MEKRENSRRSRASRVNRFIVIVVLLWIAATVALVLEAHPSHARARRNEGQNVNALAASNGPGAVKLI